MTSASRVAISAGGALAMACATAGIVPKTNAEEVNSYGYHPVDPLPVRPCIDGKELHDQPAEVVLATLPDESMRFAVGEVTATGSISFGPVKAGYAGKNYVVILDYIKYDTRLHQIDAYREGDVIKDIVVRAYDYTWRGGSPGVTVNGCDSTPDSGAPKGSTDGAGAQGKPGWRGDPGAGKPEGAPGQSNPAPTGASADGSSAASSAEKAKYGEPQPLGVPFYVGVGLRLTASLRVNEGSIDLGDLVAIGAAAQAKKVSGTLVVQTLGVSGGGISALLPMPSEISTSTIQNAIVSLGAIKAKLYENGTTVSPRVVGIYNNLGTDNARLVNKFITAALRTSPRVDLIVRRSGDGDGARTAMSSAPAGVVPASTGSAR